MNQTMPPPELPFDPFVPGRSGEPGHAGEGTRTALVRVAIDLFGRKGYDATSTRDIAGAAGVNIAGIAYHFGGKAGLHRVCAKTIAAFLAARLGPVFAGDEAADADLDPDGAAAALEAAIRALAGFMLSRPEAESVARFMVREQMDPTPTFDVLYGAVIRPRHERLCRLWAKATGESEDDEAVVIGVSTLLGQIMFFRVGRATALRRLGWEAIDAERCGAILDVIAETLCATLAARRTKVRG